MNWKRHGWTIIFAAIPVVGVLGVMHVSDLAAHTLAQAASLDLEIQQVDANIDLRNEAILDEARKSGVLSPYVDPQRIDIPIDTLRSIALRQATGELGLEGEPTRHEEFYLTQGQYLSSGGMNMTRAALPDRSIPLYMVRYHGSIGYLGVPNATFIQVAIDATTGEVVFESIGPSAGELPIDVTIADIGYPDEYPELTPQVPLPLPPDGN